MKIVFDTPKETVVVKEIKKTITELTIEDITDNSNRKTVKALTKELGQIVLWEGDAYDAIGQWTDADVTARVNDLLK